MENDSKTGLLLVKMKINLKSLRTAGFLIVLLVVPALILLKHYTPQSGFLGLIYFGKIFNASRLEEVNNLNPPTKII